MDFVVRLSDLEARIAENVAPLIDKEGFELVRIRANNEGGKGHLAFYMDRKDRERAINLDDLEYLNRLLSDVLDVLDAEKPLFKKSYDLEVSSPGVERPLTKKAHFEAAVSKTLRVRTDGLEALPKSVTGVLKSVRDDGIEMLPQQKEQTIFVPFIRLRDAHEVFDFGKVKKGKGDK